MGAQQAPVGHRRIDGPRHGDGQRRRPAFVRGTLGCALALLAALTVHAGNAADANAEDSLDSVLVVGSTPLNGSNIDRDQVPAATQVLTESDINRTGIPNLTDAILSNIPSATINDTEGNVFQPDILFRGFTASPVAGTAEGLAVYVNGARFNDAFGDTVNWDLIPPSAIASVNIEAANPVFGLNALGGSVSIRLKDGFEREAADLTIYGGTYGRKAAIMEVSHQFGDFAFYVTADATHDGGFRQTSTSDLYRLYGDLGWRADGNQVHLAVTAVHDTLGNPGATPEQSLDVDLSSIFTAPNVVDNTYLGFDLNGSHRIDDARSLQAVVYFQTLNQVIPNGTTAEVGPCDDGTGLLCNDDGTVVTTTGGKPVADFLQGATYSGLSVQQLGSHAYGVSLQWTDKSPLLALPNHLVSGIAFDGSDSLFAGVAELGGFDPYSREFIGPGVIQDQPSEGVNPVLVRSNTEFYGIFLTDVLTIAPQLDLSLAGRFNDAQINLTDELGGPVNGTHEYDRLNPSAGLTFRVAPGLQVYGSYSETNRAPTPQELSCASAAFPCSLLNFFVGDPDLHQVVAHTFEAGIRGESEPGSDVKMRWSLDAYHTENTNDIIYETTVYNPNLAFYTNAGKTLREGIEANLRIDVARLHLTAGYAWTDATFRTPLLLGSNSPAVNADGEEQVLPGDRIPGIPRHRGNLVADYDVLDAWRVGGSVVSQSSVYRFGDEANLTLPIPGYTIVDLDTQYRLGEHLAVFAVLNNALDKRYYTYGSFGPVGDVPWPNVPGGVTNPATASPGTPRTFYLGLRLQL
jgi:outer membrane receptor protein involved in Fe transport